MQIQNSTTLSGVQSIFQSTKAYSAPAQSLGSSKDTVSISPEARALYEQTLQSQEENQSSLAAAGALAMTSSVEEAAAEEEKFSQVLAEEFSKILDRHRDNTESSASSEESANSASSGSGGAGSSDSSSSSADAIEEIEQKIKEVSAELSSAAGLAVKSGSTESNTRVEQLQSELQQLQAQLAQLEAAAEDSAA